MDPEVLILRVLDDADEPMGSGRIVEELKRRFGKEYSTRSIRYHLQRMEERGLIERIRRNDRVIGAVITDKGRYVLKVRTSRERIGMYISVIEEMAYLCDFDPFEAEGKVVCNVSIVEKEHLDDFLTAVEETYKAGVGPSPFVAVEEGDEVNGIKLEDDEVAVLTVCTVTVDGVLLNQGVPVNPLCGGLLHFEDGEPLGMVEYIEYSGSTVDPLHVFVARGMTDVEGYIETGTGRIPANVRYVPWAARSDVKKVKEALEKADIRAIVDVPAVEGEVVGIPIPPKSFGVVAYGGLVPVALLEERGISVKTYPTKTLYEYSEMEDVRRL